MENKNKAGRPKTWTDEAIEAAKETILDNIGELAMNTSEALRVDGMPKRKMFYEWLDSDESFRNNYVRARDSRNEIFFDRIIEIADTKDFYEVTEVTEMQGKVKRTYDEDGNLDSEDQDIQTIRKVAEKEATRHREVRINALKWILGRSDPKKYGDKVDVTTDGKSINIISLGNGVKPPSEDEE